MERFSAFFIPYLTTGRAARLSVVGQVTSLLCNKTSKNCLKFNPPQGIQ
jgi:hypothetical protein